MISILILLHDHSGVVASETERVGEGSAHGAFLSLVESEVEAVVDFFVFVAFLVVDGGGNDVVPVSYTHLTLPTKLEV